MFLLTKEKIHMKDKLFSVYVEVLCSGDSKEQVMEAVSDQMEEVFGQENFSIYEAEELDDINARYKEAIEDDEGLVEKQLDEMEAERLEDEGSVL